MPASPSIPESRSISATPTAPGSGAATKTPTGCSASISQKERPRPAVPSRRRRRSLYRAPSTLSRWRPGSFVFPQLLRNALLQEPAGEPASGGGYRRAVELVIDHLVEHVMQQNERPEPARPRTHGLF